MTLHLAVEVVNLKAAVVCSAGRDIPSRDEKALENSQCQYVEDV